MDDVQWHESGEADEGGFLHADYGARRDLVRNGKVRDLECDVLDALHGGETAGYARQELIRNRNGKVRYPESEMDHDEGGAAGYARQDLIQDRNGKVRYPESEMDHDEGGVAGYARQDLVRGLMDRDDRNGGERRDPEAENQDPETEMSRGDRAGLLDYSRREDHRVGGNGRRCLGYTSSRAPDRWTANH